MPRKRKTERSSKKGFFIERKPNPELWKEIQTKAQGLEADQLLAVELIVSRIRELPKDADQLLLEMSKSGSLEVKRRLASLLASKPSISWGLWSDVLENLREEDDKEIKETINPLLEPYRRFEETFKQTHELLLGSIPKGFISEIMRRQATLPALLQMREDMQRSIEAFSQIRLPLEEIRKSFETANQFQLSREALDSLNTLSKYPGLVYGNFARLSSSYYSPKEEPKAPKASDHPLIVRLRELQPGQQTWVEYQKLCQEILTFCFAPPLLEPLYENTTSNGIHRRDLIYNIPHAVAGFWSHVKTAYGALAVIVDAKNYSDTLPKDQVVILSKYFGPKKLGNFGLIVTRKGLDDAGRKEQADRWVHHDEMIICLNDCDLEKMIAFKLAGKEPEYVIDQKIRELRANL